MHVVADPRLVRRVLKRQRGLTGFGMQVPHGHCCVVERKALLAIVSERELGRKAADLPPTVILVARPDFEDGPSSTRESRERRENDEVRAIWRRAFHGHIHHHLEEQMRTGALTEAVVRQRIHRIGQTEFDEIRAVLHGEELLFAANDDREAYIEFAAFYLETVQFDPDHVDKYFPTIRDAKPTLATLALDVDGAALLERCRPEMARDLTPARPKKKPSVVPRHRTPRPPRVSSITGDPSAKPGAAAPRNVVHEIVVRMRAGKDADREIDQLAHRLEAALPEGPNEALAANRAKPAKPVKGAEPPHPTPSVPAWRSVIYPLAEAAARSDSVRSVEARVLHDLQKACIDAERRRNAVDVVTWALSLFRTPIVRPLPAVSVVRIARHLQSAFERSHRAALEHEDREILEEVFRAALARAKDNAQQAIKPALEATLDEVGLGSKSVPEKVAREKLCEEILDLVLERGSLGLSQLRDALSRSNLKLTNLTATTLWSGDALLRADARLADRLDGVYRRGEIYLRALQKVSSVAFGTRIGHFLTLHLALPVLLSFVLLEGFQHLAHPIGHALGYPHVVLLTPASFAVVALFFYGLIHSDAVLRSAKGAVRAVGAVLHAIFIGLPSFVLSRAPVKTLLQSRIFSLVTKPLVVGATAYGAARILDLGDTMAIAGTIGLVVVSALFLATSLGLRLEEAFTDFVMRHLRELSRRALPGLFAFVLDVFRILVERVERGIYTVDEWLTFKDGQSRVSLVVKGALGVVWFFVTYVLRIYVNLLIEPQVNPIKHFPVVTVSHKIVLPMSPTILRAIRPPLLHFGPAVANAIAGSTVLLLPGVFGFLVWELKENWKLYDQNRSRNLEPLHIGHHGETMNGLLVVGFHQGTVPKLYAKLRRAARRGEAKVNALRQKIHEVEHALETFVDRELVGLLDQVTRWNAGDLEVRATVIASNRVRIGIACPAVSADLAWLQLEAQSGLLVASVPTTGFIDVLPEDQFATFELALAGLYKRAGVDIVREQVEAVLGGAVPYDIASEGLVVWPGDGYETEIVYALEGASTTTGVVRGKPLASPPAVLDLAKLEFARQSLSWTTWVEAFRESGSGNAPTTATGKRVIDGPPLLVRKPVS
jgi:hypothetical protein